MRWMEGLEWVVSGRAHVPVAVQSSRGSRTMDLWMSLCLNDWGEVPPLEDFEKALRDLPESFPYTATEEADGSWTFVRKA